MAETGDRPHLTLPVGARDHRRGPATAPVTLVEYGDYECPSCGQAYPIVKQLVAEVGEGICFICRNFPLVNVHRHAEHAAEAAEAAGAQGPSGRCTTISSNTSMRWRTPTCGRPPRPSTACPTRPRHARPARC